MWCNLTFAGQHQQLQYFMLSFSLACLSVLTMHFTLGPSLQLGRWDSQGPPAWAEAVLLRQEQPGSKLQEPGPLRHHKVCLTCKFAKASLAFFLFSGMAVWDPFFILFYFSLVFTNPNIFVFLQSVLLIITSSQVFVSVLQYLQQISPFAVFDFAHSFQIILLYLCRPSSLPCFHKLLIPLSHAFDYTSFSRVTSSSEKGAGFCSLFLFSLSLCLSVVMETSSSN